MITIVKNKVDKPFLQGMIKTGVYSITFKKVDESMRVMKCTLMKDRLPVLDESVERKPRKENDQVLNVWDLEKEDWRSMRIDSVLNVEELVEDGE
jgi:hypothetical protein